MKKILLSTMILSTVVISSQAATLSLYKFGDTAASLADTAGAANISSSGMSVGTGLDGSLSSITNNANSFNYVSAGANDQWTIGGTSASGLAYTDMNNANNLGLAITNGDYLTFTATPGIDAEVDFTTLTFQMRANNSNNSAERYAVFSSVGGFAEANVIGSGAVTTNATYEEKSIDLSALTDVTTATEFRIYMYGGNDSSGGFTGFDDITLSGDVTLVPEPSSTALLGLGGLALILRRRK